MFWVLAQSIYPSEQIDTLWQNGQGRRKRRRPYSLHSAKFYILFYARNARAVYANKFHEKLIIAHVNCAKNKRFYKSQVYMKHHLNRNLKKIVEFSLLRTILLLCYLDYPNSLLIYRLLLFFTYEGRSQLFDYLKAWLTFHFDISWKLYPWLVRTDLTNTLTS